MALRSMDAHDPKTAREDAARRIEELTASLLRAQAAERQQRERADCLESSLRRLSRAPTR